MRENVAIRFCGKLLKTALLAAGASIVLLLLSSDAAASGARRYAKVTDVRFGLEGGEVHVSYNLLGEPGKTYRVGLELRKRGDPNFRFFPKAVRGDVGVGKFAGPDRRIVWAINRDFPGGLRGADFYFVVKADEVHPKEGVGFLTLVGTGVAVVAAAAAYFVLADAHSPGPLSSPFPAPPGRP